MSVRIRFEGGPLHKQVAYADTLPECRVFFPPNDRLVLLYVREDELEYVFDPIKSRGLTAVYDAAKKKLTAEGAYETQELHFVDGDAAFLPPNEEAFLPPSEGFTLPGSPDDLDGGTELDSEGDVGDTD